MRNGDDLELRKNPSSTAYDELAIVHWRADVNGDGRDDLGLSFSGSGGSKGEAYWGVYVRCSGDQYVTVWGPDYIFNIDPPASAKANGTWREIVTVTRIEQADRMQHDRLERHTLRFTNGHYERVP